MASIERTAYPRLKKKFTHDELRHIYTPTTKELSFIYAHARGSVNILNLTLLLKVFQRLGYFPKLEDIPKALVSYIRDCLHIKKDIVPRYDHKRTLYRHHQTIREFSQVSPYSETNRKQIMKIMYDISVIKDNPADIINATIDEMIHSRMELPAFSTLDRLTKRVRMVVNRSYFQQILDRLSDIEQEKFDQILFKNENSDFSDFNRFKKLPKNPTLGNLKDLIDHLIWLQSFGDMKNYVQGVPIAKIKHFAAEAKSLKAKELRDYTKPKRITLVVSLLYHAQMKTRDHITEMFMKRMGNIHNAAKADLQAMKEQHQEKTEHLVIVFKEVLQVLDQGDSEVEVSQLIKSTLKESGSIPQLLADCEAVSAYHGNNYLQFILPHFRSYRASLFRLADLLHFSSANQDTTLMDALLFIQENRNRKSDWLPDKVNLSFVNADWKSFVRVKKRVGGWEISRRHLEACVFSQIATELKSGDICVPSSESFDDFREQLLPWEECEPLVADYCKELDLPDNTKDFVANLKDKLVTFSHQMDKGFPRNDNLSIDKNGKLVLKRYKGKEMSVSARELERLIKERMPERNVIDILCNVEHWIHWTRHFGPLSGSDPKLNNPRERYILNTFAYGCNLGPAQAARHMRGIVTADMLSYVNKRHFTVEKLNRASVDLINHYHKDFDLPKLWGTGKRAAADGTMRDIYEDNLLAEYHIRYGGYGAIAFRLVADNYIALFSHFIPCGVWEAVYIIEGLLQNKSDIQPDTVHADTQGQSYPVFALAHLLGIKLMPRIRNVKDRSLFRPTAETTYKHIDSLFKGTIDWNLIETHWADLMQVVLSIKHGKISSSMILRKLGNESKKNKLYQASRELGKAICTLFLLRYITDMELRQQITSETNKVEAFHGFSGWLCFGGDGVISDNDPEQQEKVIKYNELVSNAVIFQNVVDMTAILRDLNREGYLFDSEDVRFISPYLTSHIKRFGDYIIDLGQSPRPFEGALDFTG